MPINTVLYGTKFTEERYFEEFSRLFDPVYGDIQAPVYLVMDSLSEWNGFFPTDDFEVFFKGPSITDLDFLVNELGLTGSEFYKFIWKEDDGQTFRISQFLKEWLSLVFTKVTTYTGDDKSIIIEKGILLNFKNNPAFEELNPQSNRKEFSLKEAKMGKIILESASRLFGQATLRFMFGNMIGYYGQDGNFGLKVLNRPSELELLTCLNHVSLAPQSQIDGQSLTPGGRASRVRRIRHYFSVFNLDSTIILPLDASVSISTNSEDNTFTFNRGPLVAIDSSISGEKVKEFSLNLARYFRIRYISYSNRYLDYKYGVKNKEVMVKRFFNDHNDLFNLLVRKLETKIISTNYLGKNDMNRWLLTSIVNSIYKNGLLSRRASFTYSDRDEVFTLRDVFNKFALSTSDTLSIKFEDFGTTIQISQSELIGTGFTPWPDITSRISASEFYSCLSSEVNGNIEDTVEIVEQALWDLYDGVARIAPVINHNHERVGYQYFEPRTTVSERFLKELPKSTSFPFEIDLVNKPYEAREKIKFIINTIFTSTKDGNNFAFAAVKPDGEISDILGNGEIGFIIDRNGFVMPDQLYSVDMRWDDYAFYYGKYQQSFAIHRVIFNQYDREDVGGVDINAYMDSLSKNWDKIWTRSIYWDFFQHRDYIRKHYSFN
jgi:hypothetical protein